jgi:hemerythrin superfamily protein
MENDMMENRGAFPVDQPIEALIRDHNTVRKLVEAYQSGHSPEVKMQAAQQILVLLETHSKLEEGVFYPAVRNVDAQMVGHFEQEHQKADDILESLKSSSLQDQQSDQLMQQLIQMTMHHIEEEENEFFPKLQQANMDMTPIGLQMQAYEANLVHAQASGGQKRPGARI